MHGGAVTKLYQCPQELDNPVRQVNAQSYEKQRTGGIRVGVGKASRRWIVSGDLRKCSESRQLWKMAEEMQGWWLEARVSQEYRNVE